MKKILVAILLMITVTATAQLNVELGARQTELGKGAISFGISYLKSLDSIFNGQEYFVPGKHSWFMVTPELELVSGSEDAISSIVLKATGLFNVFKTTQVSGLTVPDNSKTFHSFPVSLGIEANNSFDNVNGILEVGWVPYYQSYARQSPTWVKRSKFGIFMQTGYKFNIDSTGIGGDQFASQEKVRRLIARARGILSLDTDAILRIGALNIGLVGSAEGWADIVNSEFYHKLEGRARIYLTPDQYFDVIWSSGSGAPLFNEAQQVGVGFTFRL